MRSPDWMGYNNCRFLTQDPRGRNASAFLIGRESEEDEQTWPEEEPERRETEADGAAVGGACAQKRKEEKISQKYRDREPRGSFSCLTGHAWGFPVRQKNLAAFCSFLTKK